MSFIDHTYFIADITIGDISNGNSPVVGNTVNLDFIPRYEKKYLEQVLGYPLYTAFISGLAVMPTPAAKWTELRDGVDYTVNNKPYRWNGFKNAEKISPIAYYVYSMFQRDKAASATGTGTEVAAKQNATTISPADKIAWSYVQCKELTYSLHHYLEHNRETYTDFDWCRVRKLGTFNQFGI